MKTIAMPCSARSRSNRSQHLRLDRDVERADRLVGDQQLGFDRHRPRDRDALTLPAGQLARAALGDRGRQSHESSFSRDVLGARSARPTSAVDDRRLGDRLPDAHQRVQRRVRVLVDELHRAAHPRAARAARSAEHVSRPRRATLPASGSISRTRHFASVLLPLPDSPTIPSVSRAASVERDVVDGAGRLGRGARRTRRAAAALREALGEAPTARQSASPRSPCCSAAAIGSAPPRSTIGQAERCRRAARRAPSAPRAQSSRANGSGARTRSRGGSAAMTGGWPGIAVSGLACRPSIAAPPPAGRACKGGGARRAPGRRRRSRRPARRTSPRRGRRSGRSRRGRARRGPSPSRARACRSRSRLEDLILDRHVEGCRRLVGEQQRRVAGDRHARSSRAGACRR